jgi:serine/threonine-protein kinase
VTDRDLADLPPPGTVLAGKYEVVGVLGKGGMGVVIEARHLRLNQNVALKLLLPNVREMGDTVARFEREARAAARLQSQHVVRILDVDVLPDGCPFMVMELLRGRELDVEIKKRGQLPIEEAVSYILQACAAMAVAHRMGIVHRDLKPSNLFLSEADGQRTVKVFDFGISKLAGDVAQSVTATTSAFGTPLYMSPEQVRSVKHVDARTDIWSLGVILYEMLAGKPPFQEPSATALLVAIATDTPTHIRKLRPDIPPPLANAVMRALEKDPDVRFSDVRELAAAIRPFGPSWDDPAMAGVSVELAGMSGEFGRPTVSPALRGKRRTLALAAAVAVAAVGGVIFIVTRSPDPPADAAPDLATTEPAPPSTTGPLVTPAPSTAELPVEPVPSARPTSAPIAPIAPTGTTKPKAPVTSETATPPPPTPTNPNDDPKYL